ncbi:MAG: tRNA (adenosine(37)-N6)-threonylcarbamoyltransferase complex transferase subunit TsaD [Clostridiaceae bacterium]|nr:tRNA (adenosine(37)-N6)-threonylcarbamoyltransferase complex transferase subunit TsaD [Eubacteriales bacterium]
MGIDANARLAGLEKFRREKGLLLAIETSCDETAAAVLDAPRGVRSMSVHTQIPLHAQFGGVVPELASRSHVERLGPVVEDALQKAKCTFGDLSAVAVTCGPGLVGALLTGVSYAKGIAFAKGLPLVGVNHIEGHIAANYLSCPELEPPFVCLIASGGHSHIVLVEGYRKFFLIGKTRDDAAGEAFDKAARALGLPYPGGPALERLALDGDPNAYAFRSVLNEDESFDFSFSGIKTAVVNLLHTATQKGESVSRADIAASFQRAVVNALAEKSLRAALLSGHKKLALAGGVSANKALREAMRNRAEKAGVSFYCPDFRFCTDNAAMIGCAGYYALLANESSPLSLNASPALSLGDRSFL